MFSFFWLCSLEQLFTLEGQMLMLVCSFDIMLKGVIGFFLEGHLIFWTYHGNEIKKISNKVDLLFVGVPLKYPKGLKNLLFLDQTMRVNFKSFFKLLIFHYFILNTNTPYTYFCKNMYLMVALTMKLY